ncbi:response regulator, partial [Monashia sp. NPDC004114]
MIRVLVVDDDYHVARAHALSIARVDGFTAVGEAHTGEEAQRLVGELEPDLVLLDMYLPDFSGLDLVRRLAANGHRVPDFLLVTAARDLESVRAAMQLGAFYYLVKPFTFAALREQLEAYRAWTERLRKAPSSEGDVDQDAVDALYSLRGTPSRRATAVRNLQPTMARVLEIVSTAPEPVGAAEVAEILGA